MTLPRSVETIEQTYGISIHTRYDTSIFPGSWLEDNSNPSARPISAEEFNRYKHVINMTLYRYPPDVIRNNLKDIYLLGGLRIFNVEESGHCAS